PMMTHTTVTPRPPHLPYTTLSRSSPSASRTTSRRSCPGDRAWSARPVERDKGEFGGGHLDPPAAALAQYPDLDAQRHRTAPEPEDRKSTRLNSSHLGISYAVFCLK